MGSVVVIDRSGFRGLEDKIEERSEAALAYVSESARSMVVEKTINGRDRRGYHRTDTGGGVGSIKAGRPVQTPTGYQATIRPEGPNAINMIVTERGRRPGPVSERGRSRIERWARRKLRVPTGELRSAAYLIARKVARQGFPGLWPFQKTTRELKQGEAAALFREGLSGVGRIGS